MCKSTHTTNSLLCLNPQKKTLINCGKSHESHNELQQLSSKLNWQPFTATLRVVVRVIQHY